MKCIVVIDLFEKGLTQIEIDMSENFQPGTPGYKGKEAYLDAGADYVITNLAELKELINRINSRLNFRERREC